MTPSTFRMGRRGADRDPAVQSGQCPHPPMPISDHADEPERVDRPVERPAGTVASLLGGLFGHRSAARQPIRATVRIPLEDAVRGVRVDVAFDGSGERVGVTLPAGIEDGSSVRFVVADGSERFVDVVIEPHGVFSREGDDLHCAFQLTPQQAQDGVPIQLAHPDGTTIEVDLPAATQDGQAVRCRGRGVRRPTSDRPGDLYVHIRIESSHGEA